MGTSTTNTATKPATKPSTNTATKPVTNTAAKPAVTATKPVTKVTATNTATNAASPQDKPYVPTTQAAPEHKHYHHHHHQQQQQQQQPLPSPSSLSGDSIGNFVFFGLVIAFFAWFAGMSLMGPDATATLSKQVSKIAKSAGALGSSKAGGLLHRAASGDAYHL